MKNKQRFRLLFDLRGRAFTELPTAAVYYLLTAWDRVCAHPASGLHRVSVQRRREVCADTVPLTVDASSASARRALSADIVRARARGRSPSLGIWE